MHRMDANPCACESPRSQLSHAQGFISISLTVTPEYSIENVENLKFLNLSPEFTAFSCRKLKCQSDQSSSFRGTGVYRKVTNSCALESARPQLSNAQGFISISRTIASEYSTENALFSKFSGFSTNISYHQEKLSKIQKQRHFFSTFRNILRH